MLWWKDYQFVPNAFHESSSFDSPIKSFASFWDCASQKHPWDSNPWVWVMDFKVVEVVNG
jgi:hypothetical protein